MANSWNRFSPCRGHILWPNKRLEKKLQYARTKPGITHIRTHLSPSPLNRGALLFATFPGGGRSPPLDRNEEQYLGEARNAMRFRRHGVWTRNHRYVLRFAVAQRRFRVRQETRVRPPFRDFEFVDSSPSLFSFFLPRHIPSLSFYFFFFFINNIFINLSNVKSNFANWYWIEKENIKLNN